MINLSLEEFHAKASVLLDQFFVYCKQENRKHELTINEWFIQFFWWIKKHDQS